MCELHGCVSMMFFGFIPQKRKQDDKKPLEEKIKTLKKRNAELAAIARRLEEKAKHLQQENLKVILSYNVIWKSMQLTNFRQFLAKVPLYCIQIQAPALLNDSG